MTKQLDHSRSGSSSVCSCGIQTLWDAASASPVCRQCAAANTTGDLIVVVDDTPEIRDAVELGLVQLGYGVRTANDAIEGLAVIRELRPAVVITDALMPRLDGREMCRQIKQSPDLAAIKCIVMTSLYTSTRYRNEAFKLFSADGYIAKPLDFSELARLLARLGARTRKAA